MRKLILMVLIMVGLLLTGTARVLATQSDSSQVPSLNQDEVRIIQSGENLSGLRQTGYAFRADDIIGSDVQNPKGERLASINNLVIDVESGRIAFAVLSCCDFLGFGGNLFVIPWEEIIPKATLGVFVLDITKEQLKEAPVFTPDEWPNLQDRQWVDEVYGYYGSVPGVDGYRYGSDGKVAARNWGVGMAYCSVFDPNTIQTFEAEVIQVDLFAPMAEMSEGIEVVVKSEGESINVHLGPSWYLSYQDFDLNKGDQVEVTGSWIETGGMPVVIATQIKTDEWTLSLRNEKEGCPVWSAVLPNETQ